LEAEIFYTNKNTNFLVGLPRVAGRSLMTFFSLTIKAYGRLIPQEITGAPVVIASWLQGKS
jgi:hypothetical protein